MNNKTLVLGASLNPNRYSHIAIHKLLSKNIEVKAIGKRVGEVGGVNIFNSKINFKNIHTITLYLDPKNQNEFYKYILSLSPKRVIFNPGTENEALELLLKKHSIHFEKSCTLVLLSIDEY